MQLAEQSLTTTVKFAPVDNAETSWFATKKDVFGNAQFLDEGKFLVNDGDAGPLCIANSRKPALCSIENDFTTVLRMRIDAGKNFNERRFARPVFTDERVDLGGNQIKTDA